MASDEMEDPQKLKEAAMNGDLEFLRKCVASNKSDEFYLTEFGSSGKSYDKGGNMFHYAAGMNREEFIREAIQKILPKNLIQKLILQTRSKDTTNPLHAAASIGNLEIVKLFLNVFRNNNNNNNNDNNNNNNDDSEKAWLQKDMYEITPCVTAIRNGYEECGMEILRMDLEKLSNMTDNGGTSILYEAIWKGFNNIALEILKLSPSFTSAGYESYTALQILPNCSDPKQGKEICRLLLQRDREQIEPVAEVKHLSLQMWVLTAKCWPFECLLECEDIIPDIRTRLMSLICEIYPDNGDNLLHYLAKTTSVDENYIVEVAQFLIEFYKKETQKMSNISSVEELPWLVKNKKKYTPLNLSIINGLEKLAICILSQDYKVVTESYYNTLFEAIDYGRNEVAEKILDIVEQQEWLKFLTCIEGSNALHMVPYCSENLCKRLLKHHPHLLKGVDNEGFTISHKWAQIGKIWPFRYILESEEIDVEYKLYFSKLTNVRNYNLDTPIHVLANTTNEEMDEIALLLIQTYRRQFPAFNEVDYQLPWYYKNKVDESPLHIAIRNKRQNLALCIMSKRGDYSIEELLDLFEPHHSILFLAMKHNCYQVAQEILKNLDKENWTKYVTDSSDGSNILHLAPTCTDKTFGTWLINEASEFISKPNNSGDTPLVKASSVGAEWFIKAMLKANSSLFANEPLAWIKACENGHVSAICAFIKYNPGKFRDNCVKYKDSPLHHIRLSSLTDYEDFLHLPRMKDLINQKDLQGATPLHVAIRNKDIFLTESLLCMENIMYNKIKDVKNEAAIDLLAQLCSENEHWDEMCKRIGFDPSMKTTYFQHHTNLLDVRNTISVVAALLATITFTAGFTLPGGLDQNSGEAMLAKKASFLVFLISNTLALFFSILVLVCLIWSMVYEPSKTLLLIDRSMVLLMRALYCTLIAFMTGVYVVISPKSLWAAILILVIVCTLLGISFSKTLLYYVINKLIPAANKDHIDSLRQLELGRVLPCFQGRSSLPEATPSPSKNPVTKAE